VPPSHHPQGQHALADGATIAQTSDDRLTPGGEHGDPLRDRPRALSRVAIRARQYQVGRLMRAAAGNRDNVVYRPVRGCEPATTVRAGLARLPKREGIDGGDEAVPEPDPAPVPPVEVLVGMRPLVGRDPSRLPCRVGGMSSPRLQDAVPALALRRVADLAPRLRGGERAPAYRTGYLSRLRLWPWYGSLLGAAELPRVRRGLPVLGWRPRPELLAASRARLERLRPSARSPSAMLGSATGPTRPVAGWPGPGTFGPGRSQAHL